ncbi:type III endosome membrane protein TEMP [Electrophorus electricus]|uniref:type III endosome membrane protein TEMP n=1 Tax=Electrophorus electricus TaxID=8005 RepID=UPI0015CF9626|nr:type III endosome membrane protein TEMP [Electrophorus electricus]XP_026854699.2 type III endosome membrane protein TEMP [Electrophorus electricus]
MSLVAHALCVLILCTSGFCHTLLIVGPCDVNREKVTFDCSRRNITSVPQHIWANVTKLDLSDNHLNLSYPKIFKKLQHFDHLITLNLSGNYLPLLVKQHYRLPSLEILDLSGCKLAAVQAGALLSFPRLQTLLLGNNHLQTPVSAILGDHRWIQIVEVSSNLPVKTRSRKPEQTANRVDEQMAQGIQLGGHTLNLINQSPFHRKLLTDTSVDNTGTNRTNKTLGTDVSPKSSSHDWRYLVGALVTALGVSILIAVAAKCKIVCRYLASYRHSRLNETDETSQCDPASFEVGFSSQAHDGEIIEDDDDGFIEDNYIQASDRERAARETENWEDEGEEEEMEFTIS